MSADKSTIAAALSARSVAKSYGGREVFKDVSFDIAPGEIVGIVGRSGVGKSTLLRLIGGLTSPDAGSLSVGVSDAAAKSASDARDDKVFGLMPQSPALLPWRTVEQNVSLLAEVNRAHGATPLSATEALTKVGLADRATSKPSELSGGMKQRVSMARALATQAPVLLLDEPFSSLDEMTRNELYNEVLQVWDDGTHTMVLVTHNITEAVLLCDRVIVLRGNPATITDIVPVHGARPRTAAIDAGQYVDCITRIRAALDGEVSA